MDKIIYEFVIDGMTCVNCSTAIERGLNAEFKNKGLVDDKSVNVILLVNKMKITFYKQIAEKHSIDADRVAEEVEDLGFGAKLINSNIMNSRMKNAFHYNC